MKKIPFLVILLTWTVMMVLPSCGNISKEEGDMQKPITQLEATSPALASVNGEVTKGMNAADAGAKTYADMQEAFKGETTASAKYAAYSKKAEAEGFHQIALLFNAASISEKTHAGNHRAVLEEAGQQVPSLTPEFTVKSTKENLMDAIAGETYEITTMYPAFIKDAAASGKQLAQISLTYAYKTEQKHKPLYENALASLEAKNVNSLPAVYYVCPTCGNTYDAMPPRKCGISMTGAEKFVKVSTVTS
jgi:rubrerythrin